MTDPTKPDNAAAAPSPEPKPVWPQQEWLAAAPTAEGASATQPQPAETVPAGAAPAGAAPAGATPAVATPAVAAPAVAAPPDGAGAPPPTAPVPVLPFSTPPHRGGVGPLGLAIGAIILVAILSSLGTFVLLSATGHLNTTSTASTSAPVAVASPAAPGGGSPGGTAPEPSTAPQPGATPGATGQAPGPNLGGRLGGLFRGMFGGGPVVDAIAKSLGITTDQLVTEIQQLGPGDGLCTLAARPNVDCATVKSAARDAVKSQLDNAVKAGNLDQQRADRMLATIDAWLAAGGNLPFFPLGNVPGPGAGQNPGTGPGFGGGPGPGAGPGSSPAPRSSPGPGNQATNRPWIGLYYVELDPTTAKTFNTPVDHGALIQRPQGSDQPAVQPGSPAAAAGLREGDIVVSMDGQQVDATHPLSALVLAHRPGDTVRLDILRDGQTITVTVTLGTRPATQ